MRLPRQVAAAIITVLLVAGCGADGVEPGTWVRDVCGSLTQWRGEIQLLTAKAHQQGTGKAPEVHKAAVVATLDGKHKATETARQQVSEAGIPAVDYHLHTNARDSYATARDTVQQLPLDRVGNYYTAMDTALTKLDANIAASEFDTRNPGSTELRQVR